jgi:Cd2+/Zn2+-exporting ATPase
MAHDLQLDLDVLLPEAHGDADRCVIDLVGALRATAGIRDVHLVPADAASPARLCLHVEPGGLSLTTLADKARSVGAELSSRYGHAAWRLRDITHATRAENAAAILRRLPGVLDATVAVGGPARLEFDRQVTTEAALRTAAAAAGVPLAPRTQADEAHGHDHAEGGAGSHDHDSTAELLVAAGAFAVYVVARVLDWTTGSDVVPTALYVTAAVVTAATVGRDVLATIRARRFDIEVLMWVAAAGAAVLGHWSDAALLLVLFSLGHSLEGYAMGRARREIEALGDLAPPTAHRRTGDGVVEEVPVEALAVGDLLVVRPNERIAADGVVVAGTSSVDEAPITGESVPVDKQPASGPGVEAPFEELPRQHRVFSGTLNGTGAIEVRVARPAQDSTLARVVRLVAEADTQVSPTQVLTQRVVRIFIPAVFVLVGFLLVVPPLAGEPFRDSFMRAMAVLVAASPCALAIATPSAVLAAIARSARAGVLVKGGGPLEGLGRVRAVAFDKTGTLTEGRPRLVAVEPVDGADQRDLLAVTLAVERLSDHPLATAITDGAIRWIPDLAQLDATDVQAVAGKGVVARVAGETTAIGNAALFEGTALPASVTRVADELERAGTTTMIVRHGDRFVGVIGVMDTPRPEAADTIRQLFDLGVQRTVMLSGDRQRVADAVAARVGVPEALGGLLPEDKVAAVRELAAADRHGVAMVGDGVNDAPALATANVGVAMGAAGSDIALETADIALMADRLDRLPFTVGLARRASRVIRQNLFFSLGVVAVLIPLTILGVGIGPAVIAHEGSTLVVVANALLLLAYRDGSARPRAGLEAAGVRSATVASG